MTPTRGLKRLALGLAAILAVAVGGLAAAPLLVRAEAVREAVVAEIGHAAGFERVSLGEASISPFPAGAARFSDVVLGVEGDHKPLLSAERLTAQLRFFPLLFGRIEVAEITLLQPRVLIEFDADGATNWARPLARLSRALAVGSRSEQPVSFSEIRLVGGSVEVRSAARGTNERLEALDLSLAWPAISKSFGATGNFVWRGEKIDASLTLADFAAALNGERSGLKMRLSGAPLKLAFDGHIGRRPTLKLEGTLAADSPSLRNVLRWMGQEPLAGGGFGRFALKAQTNVVGETVALSSVNVELDGNAAEGVLTLTGNERPLLQGTLAADQIDISPYVAEIRLRGANEHDWDRVPLALRGFTSVDFDLRVSASRIAMPGAKLGRTAIGASLRGGRLVLTIGESEAFGGMLKGSLALAKAAAGAEIKAQLQFTDVEMESSLAAVFGIRRVEGRGNMQLALESAGADVEALSRAINGSGELIARKGALTGLNVEQLLRRLERRPLSGAGDFRTGRTPFEKLAIRLKIHNGVAAVEHVQLEGAAVRLALGGSASIASRALDLKGLASLVATSAKDSPAFELPFVVRGPWDDPVMLPDVQSLIRRSGAAAPLLDAVRGGGGRDAVRSAIEQLTRGAETQQAITPSAAAPSSAPAQ